MMTWPGLRRQAMCSRWDGGWGWKGLRDSDLSTWPWHQPYKGSSWIKITILWADFDLTLLVSDRLRPSAHTVCNHDNPRIVSCLSLYHFVNLVVMALGRAQWPCGFANCFVACCEELLVQIGSGAEEVEFLRWCIRNTPHPLIYWGPFSFRATWHPGWVIILAPQAKKRFHW